jgi:hypothetical protein
MKYFILKLCLIESVLSHAQLTSPANNDSILIGPVNVDHHFDAQSEHYIAMYNARIDAAHSELEQLKNEVGEISQNLTGGKKSKHRIHELDKLMTIGQDHI